MPARSLSSLLFLLALVAFLASPFAPLLPTAVWVALALLLAIAGLVFRFVVGRSPAAASFHDPVRIDAAPSLETLRAEKDRLFKYDPGSPLRPDQRAPFTGLRYFPVDPNAAMIVRVQLFSEHPAVPIPTNAGQVLDYLRWGEVRFDWQGEPCRLTVYRADPGDPNLFVPFADTTTGKSTYGAGRYLELLDREDGAYLLDFNRAYNPYCAYNADWSCPLPPAENRLPVAIEAGERTFDETDTEVP